MKCALHLACLFTLLCAASLQAQTEKPVADEMTRLFNCPEVFQTTAPVFSRVVWRAPSDIREITTAQQHAQGLRVLEFGVSYEHTNFYLSAEQAAAATDFHPLLILRHRITYHWDFDHITAVHREALVGKKWESQTQPAPGLTCWQPPTP